MITPRVTRLLRASDLRTFQSAIAGVVPRGWDARRTAIVVPSRSAAEELRRTIEDLTLAADGPGMTVMPDLVTRHELYARMQEHLADAPRLLTDFDRDAKIAFALASWLRRMVETLALSDNEVYYAAREVAHQCRPILAVTQRTCLRDRRPLYGAVERLTGYCNACLAEFEARR